MSILKPGSRCTVCLTPLGWYDNIPIISFLILGGKCRNCKSPISIRYALIELLTGVIFCYTAFLIFYKSGSLGFENIIQFIIMVYLASAMIVATFIDLEFRIIPNEITYSGVILSIALSTFFPFIHQNPLPSIIDNKNLAGLASALMGTVAGGGLIYIIGVIGKLIFGKEAMGFGDVKYMAMLGGFLGWKGILLAFVLACLIGSIFGIITWIITKDRYIAFGPYLSLGGFLMLFFRDEVYKLVELYQSLITGQGI